ncbi:hypothetical protein D030_0157B, partial [Vibrio parahaemolyticus AQ3810]
GDSTLFSHTVNSANAPHNK